MTFTGTDGTVILIDNGSIQIAHAPSGMVGFDDSGNKWVAGNTAAHVDTSSVEAKCAAANCPLVQCGAKLTTTFVREIDCRGISLWAWPQGVHLATVPPGHSEVAPSPLPGRRQLQLGECNVMPLILRCRDLFVSGQITKSTYDWRMANIDAAFQKCLDATIR